MVAAGLSDHEIDQLLTSAELSLASKPSDQAVALQGNQQSRVATSNLTLAHKPSPPTSFTGNVGKETPKSDLTLRVPQPKARGKKSAPDNAGAAWNYMPRTQIDDPKVKRDFQLLRMRGVVDRKKFWKKDSRKDPFPTFSQLGTLVEGPTEHHNGRLTRKERKRTLVEEILATGESDGKFKDRYQKIQEKQTSGKKGHYKKLMAARRKRR